MTSATGPGLEGYQQGYDAGVKAERVRIQEQVGDVLGHDLRALAAGAEDALHCIWPTMFLRVLDIIGWQDRAALGDEP